MLIGQQRSGESATAAARFVQRTRTFQVLLEAPVAVFRDVNGPLCVSRTARGRLMNGIATEERPSLSVDTELRVTGRPT